MTLYKVTVTVSHSGEVEESRAGRADCGLCTKYNSVSETQSDCPDLVSVISANTAQHS